MTYVCIWCWNPFLNLKVYFGLSICDFLTAPDWDVLLDTFTLRSLVAIILIRLAVFLNIMIILINPGHTSFH